MSLRQVEFQSCLRIVAADELLGNSRGVAQPVVLDKLDVGEGVRINS